MTIDEILEAFRSASQGEAPIAALEVAVAQREAITPRLLQIVDDFLADPERFVEADDWLTPNFAIYLLAVFREKAAHSRLCRLFAVDHETLEWLLSDGLTQDGSSLLYYTFDGDLGAMDALIANPDANEYARAQAMGCMAVMRKRGLLGEDELKERYRRYFRGGVLAKDAGYPWNEVAFNASVWQWHEFLPDIEQAFADGCCDSFNCDLKSLTQLMHGIHPWPSFGGPMPDIAEVNDMDDAVALIQSWPFFEPEDVSKNRDDKLDRLIAERLAQLSDSRQGYTDSYDEVTMPLVREAPKVGRNDPCPCGSGKKFKKCCVLLS